MLTTRMSEIETARRHRLPGAQAPLHAKEGRLCCNSRRCTNLLDYISVMPTIALLFSLFWLIFAPVFYFRVFLPCWDCYDFEATVAHE